MAKKHPSIELFFFDAGGGHRNATTALKESIAEMYPDWRVDPVNFQQLMSPIDPFYRLMGIKSEDIYNRALRNGWTHASETFLRTMQRGIRANAPRMQRQLEAYWKARGTPDMVVSIIPNFNRVMFNTLRGINTHTPYVTVMTDLADTPPHFWQEDQDQYMICGSEMAYRQANMSGFYQRERVFKTSGMILKPIFYKAAAKDAVTRKDMGLADDKPTAIIMFGGNGSKLSIEIMDEIEAANIDMQFIVMCGHDKKLKAQLESRPNCHAVGFTHNVPDYMRAADIFIGKPGPGSLAEALHLGLPAIVENNRRTMVQERYNVTYIQEREAGIGLEKFKSVARAARYLSHPKTLAEYKAKAKAAENRAVYEIPGYFADIMAENKIWMPKVRAA